MATGTITIKTETEHLLYKYLNEEKEQRKKYENLVKELQDKIVELQQQLVQIQEDKNTPPAKQPSAGYSNQVQYETDEEELAKETEWVRQQSRKKRKLNQSLSPQQESISREDVTKVPKARKAPQPPPIIVENVTDYQSFFDLLSSSVAKDSFLIKMKSGNVVKINCRDGDSYRTVTQFLLQNNCVWFSYENKQDRPIRVMAKNLHSTCVPARIIEDLVSKGYNVEDAVNKLSWRTKEPLNMFMISFNKNEDVNKIYKIQSILGCKVDIQPLKTSKLIPQCKRCQAYGHTHKYCSKEPRCVKCTGKHLTKDCKKPAEAKPKCVHCGEQHPASYRGCTVAKELQKLKNKISHKNQISTTQAQKPDITKKAIPSQQVTKNVSFAQITKGFKPQTQPKKQPTLNMEDKLNTILNFISSYDERFKNIEKRLGIKNDV